MNEVTRVHLGRQPFTIAVDAHKLLKAYLAAIEKHVGKNAPEVVEEVELWIAELLIERGITGEKTVLVSDIEHVKEQLGKPADFGDDGAEIEDEPTVTDTPRRLFRDTDTGKLGGVASGLAAYLNLDVTLVRIAFIILTVAWGGGIVLYLIMWLVVPEAKTGSDYLQLRGKPITVDTIKEFVDQADVSRKAVRARTVGTQIVTKLARAIAWVCGLGLALTAALTALWTIAFGVYAWIAPERLSDAGQIFPKESLDYFFMASVMTAILGSCVALFLAGIALMRRKRVVAGWIMAGIVAVVFVGTAIALPLGFKVVPDAADRFEAATQVQTRSLEPYTRIQVTGDQTDVRFVPSNAYKMEIKASREINEEAIKTEIRDGILYVETGDVRSEGSCKLFCISSSYPELTIYGPALVSADLRDGAVFRMDRALQQDTLELHTDGSVTIRMNHLYATQAKVTVDGDRRIIQLSGLDRNATGDDALTADMYADNLFLNRAGALELVGDVSCEDYDSVLLMYEMPASLLIGGQKVSSEDQLRDLQSSEKANIFNCVVVSPGNNFNTY